MRAAEPEPRVARPRGPSSVSESRLSERARIVIGAPGVSARASRYGQQPRVLLGLLGDPQDRRLRARLEVGQRVPAGRLRAVSRSIGLPCGQARVPQQLVELRLDSR